MNLQSLSISVPTLLPGRAKSLYNGISARGSCCITKWVPNSHKNFGGDFGKSIADSRFKKRVSEACYSLRNDGGLVRRVMCGGGSEREGDREEAYYMRRCVELARQAIGCTSPNPMVGCVIVRDGEVVGEGFHPKAGQPHAEVFALRNAGELAENATAYVSLEPCNHYGRTPPCTEALIKAKVKKVVVGMVDPNPLVSSKGIDRLREAGIEVIVGIEEDLCRKLNEAFIHKMLFGKPFVSVRYSISINGLLSDQLDEEAMKCGGYYSKLLQEYDAVIHAPTIATQEFSIYASQEPSACQPLHILIAKNPLSPVRILNLPTEADCKAIVFSDKEVALEPETSQLGIETVVVDQISLDAILEYCNRQGFYNVLVDMRGNLDDLGDIMDKGLDMNLLQKVVVEVLPSWSGGKESVSGLALASLTQTKRLKNLSSRAYNNSVLLEGYL